MGVAKRIQAAHAAAAKAKSATGMFAYGDFDSDDDPKRDAFFVTLNALLSTPGLARFQSHWRYKLIPFGLIRVITSTLRVFYEYFTSIYACFIIHLLYYVGI